MMAGKELTMNMPDLPDITFDHTGFITPDLETSVRFWEDILGFRAQPIGERKEAWISQFLGVDGVEIRLAHLFGHGTHIEFIQFMNPEDSMSENRLTQGNVGHVCLSTSDADALRARILAGGGSDRGRMVTITEGTAEGRRGLYMADPHGLLIEILE